MDLRKVKKLLGLMEEHNLAEIEIEAEGEKVRLRKSLPERAGAPPLTAVTIPAMPAAAVTPVAPVPTAPAPVAGEEAVDSVDNGTVEIVSPMVGTFYRSGSPEAEPFISVGESVDDETVVCIIEAMKVMNTIKAEMTGEVVAILVEDGEAVEYGQPLFAIKPSAS